MYTFNTANLPDNVTQWELSVWKKGTSNTSISDSDRDEIIAHLEHIKHILSQYSGN